MTIDSRYVDTNLVARDWKNLASFYETVFACSRVPPECDLAGRPLDDATGIDFAYLKDPEGNLIEVHSISKDTDA